MPFGVLLIRDGGETGPSTTHNIGTLARITDWYQGSDGLLGITAIGEQRFRLIASERQDDGLNIGDVERLDNEPTTPLPEEYQEMAAILAACLTIWVVCTSRWIATSTTRVGSLRDLWKFCRSTLKKNNVISNKAIRSNDYESCGNYSIRRAVRMREQRHIIRELTYAGAATSDYWLVCGRRHAVSNFLAFEHLWEVVQHRYTHGLGFVVPTGITAFLVASRFLNALLRRTACGHQWPVISAIFEPTERPLYARKRTLA